MMHCRCSDATRNGNHWATLTPACPVLSEICAQCDPVAARRCLPPGENVWNTSTAAASQIRVFLGFRTSGCETTFGVPSPFAPFLFPPLPSSVPSYPPILSLPFKSRPLKSSWKVLGAVSSPSGVWGGAPAEIEFVIQSDIRLQQTYRFS